MFTGIIEELGEIVEIRHLEDSAVLAVRGPLVTSDATHGSSIAVNGVCLTVTGLDGDTFTVDVMAESLQRTSLGDLVPGDRVNLERAMASHDRFGGHIVQGHVDGTGRIRSRTPGDPVGGRRDLLPARGPAFPGREGLDRRRRRLADRVRHPTGPVHGLR